MRRLAAGVYTDDAGTIHIDAPDFCAALGVPATRFNQDELERIVRDVVAELYAGDVPTVTRDDDAGWRR